MIKSLDLKKNRLVTGLFIAEGKKLVLDLLRSGIIASEVYCTNGLAAEIVQYLPEFKIHLADKEELARISFLKSAPEIIAVLQIPHQEINWMEIKSELTLVLDAIQDPGNLGTIVRLADWFGIQNIVCSEECADLYNPKTIQSTMGAFARVKVHYVSLPQFLSQAIELNLPVYGTFLEGENLFTGELSANGLIVMGNEGNGISELNLPYISRKLTIPAYPPGATTSESLNVALATSVICSEFRRRVICKG